MRVIIRGGGIAAYCCAFLLKKAGFHVFLEETSRANLPAIMLSDAALDLMRDVFEQPDLFRNLPRIQKRVVAWGANSTPVVLDHSAVAVSEQLVLESIRPTLIGEHAQQRIEPDWTVIASHPLPAGSVEHRFGSRTGCIVSVELASLSSAASCWIESLENGWLFLIENVSGAGWLLGIGSTPESLLDQSRVIEKRIARCCSFSGEVPAYPRIASPLCGSQWLACGTAAMAFDPICGDGTAHAIREAVLAAAVIRAASQGADTRDLLSHYEARLLAGFKRHLELCLEFYKCGHRGPWWELESAALEEGLEWCSRKLEECTEVRYRLDGFELREIR